MLAAALVLCAGAGGCEKPGGSGQATPSGSASAAPTGSVMRIGYDPTMLSAFGPLPAKLDHPGNPPTDAKVALGRRLYFDKRLSLGKDVSCNDCHDVGKNGDDGKVTSPGTKGAANTRNTPTIFNAAGAHAQGWDARASTIEAMISKHVTEATIMGLDEKGLVAALAPEQAAFKAAFPDEKTPVSAETFGKAVGAYARKLVTPSRWDKFIASRDPDLLTEPERYGLGAFLDAGCNTCHLGKYMGASQNQKLGIARPWPGPAGAESGREAVTKQPTDKGVFKVPTLRNVTRTGPWMHDGSIANLEEIVRLMARHQVGKDISDVQVKSIVTFLHTMDGEPPPTALTSRP